MKRQEAQSNSVAERRGWEQPRARQAVDNESELDSADGTTGEPASQGRSRASARADGMTTPTSHGKGWSQKKCPVVGDRMSVEVAAHKAGDPGRQRAGVHAQGKGSRRAVRSGSQRVHSSASNMGKRGERKLLLVRRRITTAGAK